MNDTKTKKKEQDFIEKSVKVHNGKYDYSKVIYKNCKTKVCIICPEHGEFWQTPSNHLNGQGCPMCARKKPLSYKNMYAENFVKKSSIIHNNKYDYSKSEYKGNHTKVCIICPEHGEFWQEPASHMNGRGCPICGKIQTADSKRNNVDDFITKAKLKHGDKYDYSKVKYINNHTKVCIICPEHGEFWQTPVAHLQGKGCAKCGLIKISDNRKYNTEIFINKAKVIHGDYYDYSNVNYNNCFEKVCITCPKHGNFYQSPSYHLSGNGCPKCGREKMISKESSTTEDFIKKAEIIHKNKYIYSKVQYVNSHSKVCIICPEHGEFWQTPTCHLEGKGCQKCNLITSKAEDEIIETLIPLEIEKNNRKILNGKEIDVYIPQLKIGIEYNGLYWHSEKYSKDKNYHLIKLNECHKKMVNLIQIFEDEWIYHKEICKYILKEICGINNTITLSEKEYEIAQILNKDEAYSFLEKYNLNGKVGFSIGVGAFYKKKLIALATFKKIKNNCYCINSVSFDINFRVLNFEEKYISYFIKEHINDEILIKIDRRYEIFKEKYLNIGFTLDKVIPPICYYYNKKEKYNRYKNKPTNLDNVYRIWDCGFLKLTYNKK